MKRGDGIAAMQPASDSWALITGGCGFVGTNLADRLLRDGHRVCVFDNLSRPGVERNLDSLRATHGDRLIVRVADVRDGSAVRDAVAKATHVFHLAAQVAVTTSLDDPLDDFAVNAGGTLNLLEAIRRTPHQPPLFYTSTNKVYGGLDDVDLEETEDRYRPRESGVAANGISERRTLDFHSPYGCSKGTADQYVLDYARSFGLRTVVFRMSCVYGPHQFGTEDQGWVAHFLISAINREPITIYGDGKQVRDVLFVEDLVEAFVRASDSLERCSGRAFNIGGGTANSVSLRELLRTIGSLEGREPRVSYEDWRTGDQRYYVSDATAFRELTGWTPAVGVHEGVRRLREWLIRSGVPALVQHADERQTHPNRVPLSARATADVPVASVPLVE